MRSSFRRKNSLSLTDSNMSRAGSTVDCIDRGKYPSSVTLGEKMLQAIRALALASRTPNPFEGGISGNIST